MTCQPSKIKMESDKCWCPNLRLLQSATLRFYASFLRCMHIWLVVWSPLKNIRQIGILPRIEVQKKNIWNHNLYPFTCWRFVKHEASLAFPWLQVEVNSSNEDYLFLAMTKNPKNWISFREIHVLLRHHHQKFKPPILPSMIHDSWIFMIQPFQESFPPFPSILFQKISHLSTTLAACCPPPKRFTSENTVGQRNIPPGKDRWRSQLPLVLVDHRTLQIATFWGWLAIYFHYMVYIPISEMVHYKWTQTEKLH